MVLLLLPVKIWAVLGVAIAVVLMCDGMQGQSGRQVRVVVSVGVLRVWIGRMITRIRKTVRRRRRRIMQSRVTTRGGRRIG